MKGKSYISRSVYQKLAEENKSLMRDLKIISTGDPVEAFIVRKHWRERFKKEEKFWNDLREILKEEVKEHTSSINQKQNV